MYTTFRKAIRLQSGWSVSIVLACLVLFSSSAWAGAESISSRIETTESGELVLIQSLIVEVPLEKAWRAYTTEEGWRGWVAPLVEFDLRTGGIIRTNYDETASLDGPGTIINHIVNLVPQHFLTLQAELSEHFPAFLQEDEDRLFNIVKFESIDDETTKIMSYGTGYRDNEKYRELMAFFVKANEWSFEKLIAYLEKGEMSDYQFGK